MHLLFIGIIADILWHQIPYHSKNIKLDAFVIMPNHIHCINLIENEYKREYEIGGLNHIFDDNFDRGMDPRFRKRKR